MSLRLEDIPADPISNAARVAGLLKTPWQVGSFGTGLLESLTSVRELTKVFTDVREDSVRS